MAGQGETQRLLVLGAHPDDAEFHAGGLAVRYRQLGHEVKLVSVTNGGAGHHWRSSSDLVALRRAEAAAAGAVIGASYETWDFPDGSLQPTLEVRERIIREIREFAPDLVLTHRLCDYHPDHRAVGQAVQDASYLVTVPLVVPDVPPLKRDPVVAYMVDLFTKPYPFQPDVVLDITPQLDRIVEMLAQHASQVFEFLPHNKWEPDDVPEGAEARRNWLRHWFGQLIERRTERFAEAIERQYGAAAAAVRYIEAYEISEYAAAMDAQTRQRLFGGACGPHATP